MVCPAPTIALNEASASQPPIAADRDGRSRAAHPVSVEIAISVEITTPERFLTVRREWQDLVDRALEANVFMEPGVVAAAASSGDAPIHVLLAWAAKEAGASIRLVGAWAFMRARTSSGLPIAVLKTPVHDHAYLGIPVLDADLGAGVLMRMLDAIAEEPSLPKFVEIASFDAAGPVATLFADVLARRGAGHAGLDPRLRPQLQAADAQAAAAPLSASRAKALRQRRQRLGRRGPVTCTLHAGREAVDVALGEFLVLEAAGWKGKASQRGQAIGRRPSLEAFFRSAVEGLAADGMATVTALRCDGKPVAMQVTVRSGSAAFTWKSAYDEELKACAPGIILLQEVTAALLSDPSVSTVDSCNHRDDGYMAEFWNGRKPVQDMVLDARPGATLPFQLLSCAERSRRQLQAEARRIRRIMRSVQGYVSSAVHSLPGFGTASRRPEAGAVKFEGRLIQPPGFDPEVVRSLGADHRRGDGGA